MHYALCSLHTSLTGLTENCSLTDINARQNISEIPCTPTLILALEVIQHLQWSALQLLSYSCIKLTYEAMFCLVSTDNDAGNSMLTCGPDLYTS